MHGAFLQRHIALELLDAAEGDGVLGRVHRKVDTIDELDVASHHRGASYIEIVLDRSDLPPKYAHGVLATLYKTTPARA